MTLEQKVDLLIKEVRTIKKVVMPEPGSQWVKMSKVCKETGLKPEQIRYARIQDQTIARQKTNKRYEYDLNAFKKIAA